MATNKGQEQSQKPFDGSKGSNIRHQDDFVKYKFLETVKNRQNEKVRSGLRKKSENTTVQNIDYNRVDGFSNYTLQNSRENGDLSERKQNLKKQKLETETEKNILEPKEKSEQPLANNRTDGSESMTKTKVKNGSFSSSKRDSDLENLDKKRNAQGAGGRGAHPPAANHGPPPGPIYPVNRGQAAPPQPRYNPPPPQWNQPPPQNQWNRPPPQQFYQNHPPTHPPRYLPPPTHPPRHYYPPPRRARPTPAPYVPPKTTRPTTTTTTTTKKPEIEYDIEGPPRTTQAPPPTRTRPTARPKCDYWSMDPFGNLQFYPCQRPVFRPPTTTPAPAPMFYFYDVPTPDPWKWYDYPNEVKIEVKVERDKRTK
ncbi:hypothetical protein FSP39_002739 [Pinctada imbricata]|uniref:Uncharacterized protein n=1 Tax=Pinctada imbricata TaxID=66713 RepID=A0AA88YLK0_PINIB|nr:hypothetical protein FSP39_002739 [Pinctada imbricata]